MANPFAGQSIAGLYDNSMRSAAGAFSSKLAFDAANKRNFASLINTGLVEANKARQAELNRQAEAAMLQEQDKLARERAARDYELKLQYGADLYKQEQELGMDNLQNYADSQENIMASAADPDMAARASGMDILRRASFTKKPEWMSEAKRAFGVDDIGLAAIMQDPSTANYDTPYFKQIKENVKLRLAGENAKNQKSINEQLKSDEELKVSQIQGKRLTSILDSAESFVNDNDLSADEKLFFVNQANNRQNIMMDEDARKQFVQEGQKFLTARSKVENFTNRMNSLQKKFEALQEAGADITVGSELKAILETVGDKDAASVAEYMDRLTEENFFISGGRLDPESANRIKRDILTDINLLKSDMTYIGRNFQGQVGTQTEQDFSRNMAAVFLPGQSLETRIQNLSKGKLNFDGDMVAKSFLYGDVDYATRKMKQLRQVGAAFDEFGAIKMVPGAGTPAQNAMFTSPQETTLLPGGRTLESTPITNDSGTTIADPIDFLDTMFDDGNSDLTGDQEYDFMYNRAREFFRE